MPNPPAPRHAAVAPAPSTGAGAAAVRRAVLLAALCLASLVPGPRQAAAAAAGKAADARALSAAVDAYVRAAESVQHFQGTVLVARDGVPLLEKGYGMASRELAVPNTPATKFLLGSVTKQFTAAAILQLQEQGKLSVQDPIAKHLPGWPKPNGDRITIHQLLSHTSGLPNYTDDGAVMSRRVLDLSLDELCATFQDKPLDFEPGTGWAYSNSGYVVLGRIVEAASGQSYEDYLREHVFGPAGMADSGYGHLETVIPGRACGHAWQDGHWVNAARVAMSIPYAAGALYATAADLLRWDQALYGDKVLSAASRQQMFTPVRQDYGYGQMIADRFGHREIMHGGGIDGFTSHLARYPDDRLTVIVLCNNESVQASAIGLAIAAILFGQPYDVPVAKTPVALDPARLDDYVGAYRIADGQYRLIRRDGDQLLSQRSGGPARKVFPEARDRFYYDNDNATTVAFERDAQGRVVAQLMHQQGVDARCERVTGALADSLLAGPAEATVDPVAFAACVGDYELGPGFVLTVRTRDGRFFGQATGQQELELFAAGPDEFFLKVVDAQLSFQRDATGAVTGLVLHQGGRDMPARKVR